MGKENIVIFIAVFIITALALNMCIGDSRPREVSALHVRLVAQ